MAGLFGFFDFTRPGPGVPENEPEKRRIFVYFITLWRRALKLVQLNLIYFISGIPVLILYYYLSGFIVNNAELRSWLSAAGGGYSSADMRLSISAARAAFSFFAVATLGAGPLSAGNAYILRNFSRGEHSWVWSDFWEQARKNFSQSSALLIINSALLIVFAQSMRFYSLAKGGAPLYSLILLLTGFFIALFFAAHFYVYPLMVTYKLSLKNIYKNALLFSLMRLIPNLLILALTAGFILLGSYFPAAGFVIMAAGGFSFLGFTAYFYTTGVLQKMMPKVEDEEK